MFTPHLNLWLIQNLSGKWGKQEDREEVGMTAGRKRGGGEEEEILLQLEQTNAQKAAESRDPEMEGHDARRTAVDAGRNLFSARAVKTEEEI